MLKKQDLQRAKEKKLHKIEKIRSVQYYVLGTILDLSPLTERRGKGNSGHKKVWIKLRIRIIHVFQRRVVFSKIAQEYAPKLEEAIQKVSHKIAIQIARAVGGTIRPK